MKVLELFAGTRSIGKAFESRGHEVFSVEWDKSFADIDLYEDISKITAEQITDYAKFCDCVDQHVVDLIKELQPKFYFIENPRGGMRKMSFVQGLPRYTVTYCKYGDERMKPTDIWTNHPNPRFLPPCKNGDKCHVAAPRGSRTGTQGIIGSKDRSRIPPPVVRAYCRYL